MSFLKKALTVLVLLVVVLAAAGFLLPAAAHVERTTTVDAPPERLFALVSDFSGFNRWSPWFQLDPATRYTYEGQPGTKGSKMSWQSESPDVGSGSQEIVALEAPRLVTTKLDFGDQGSAMATFRLEPVGTGTRVTWAFDTDLGMNPVARYFGLMFDSMIGPDYERGLANLKRIAETPADAPPAPAEPEAGSPAEPAAGGSADTAPAGGTD
jgi:uncharacterized protein YndB with AHSA1/START domain